MVLWSCWKKHAPPTLPARKTTPPCLRCCATNGAVLSIDKGSEVYHLPPIAVSDEVDPTGCGDTFAAVFLYNYLLSKDPLESAAVANRYAAAKVTFAGLDGFEGIGGIIKNIGAGTKPVKIR